jgi:hypothetical protein
MHILSYIDVVKAILTMFLVWKDKNEPFLITLQFSNTGLGKNNLNNFEIR